MLSVTLFAVVTFGIFERLVIKKSPRLLRFASIAIGSKHLEPLSDVLRERLIAPGDADYRTSARAAPPNVSEPDWSQLDVSTIEREASGDAAMARFSVERKVLSFVSRETWGKNRTLWAVLYDVSIDGDVLILVPRVYVGGIVFGVFIALALVALSAKLVPLALMLLVWNAFRMIITYATLSDLVPSLAIKSAAILNATDTRTRLRVELPSEDEASVECPTPDSEREHAAGSIVRRALSTCPSGTVRGRGGLSMPVRIAAAAGA